MKKCVNGKYIELTEEEICQLKEEQKLFRMENMKRSKTFEEGSLELQKTILLQQLENNEDKTLAVACMAFFETWTNGIYNAGDIRTSPITGYPYECILAHDSVVNKEWTIDVRTLWKPYHSMRKEYALPWEQPTGQHDMYKTGEFMIWSDNEIYRCKVDTNFSPEEYPNAWEDV